MTTSADLLVARADHDRRLELAGVDPYGRRHHADLRHGHGRPATGSVPAAHPLAAFVARLLGRQSSSAGPAVSRPAPSGAGVVAGRPRHP